MKWFRIDGTSLDCIIIAYYREAALFLSSEAASNILFSSLIEPFEFVSKDKDESCETVYSKVIPVENMVLTV